MRRGTAVLGGGAGGACAGAALTHGRHRPAVRWPGVERGGALPGGVDVGGAGGAVLEERRRRWSTWRREGNGRK